MEVCGFCMSKDSIGRDTSGIIWFASEHTHRSEKARSGGIPALRRIEANAWQREKGPDEGEPVATGEEAAAAPPGRAVALTSDDCMGNKERLGADALRGDAV